MTSDADVLIVGAGAAGLVAAIFAARAGARVLVLESTPDGGRKILISGGGRCNILPAEPEPERFVTDSPRRLVRHLLRSWPLDRQRAFFETLLGAPLVLEEPTQKWFPASNRARDVRDALVAAARASGAGFRFGSRVVSIERERDGWLVSTPDGSPRGRAVVLATGGLSVPRTGSDGTGLDIARRLGHRVIDPYPALTPLVANPPVHAELAGVSLRVELRAPVPGRTVVSRGGFLFTHRGYSGPSMLDVSHLAVRARIEGRRQPILVNWAERDRAEWDEELRSGTGLVITRLRARLPDRLAQQLLSECGIAADQTVATLRRERRLRLLDALCQYELPWTSDEGFRTAEVTGGGVALDEVDPRTLESRRAERLFLCGEMLDAFGPIGGHNFAWAWATGRLAGLGAAARAGIGTAMSDQR